MKSFLVLGIFHSCWPILFTLFINYLKQKKKQVHIQVNMYSKWRIVLSGFDLTTLDSISRFQLKFSRILYLLKTHISHIIKSRLWWSLNLQIGTKLFGNHSIGNQLTISIIIHFFVSQKYCKHFFTKPNQKQPPEVFYKKNVLKNFAKLAGFSTGFSKLTCARVSFSIKMEA